MGIDDSEAAETACRFVAGRTWPSHATVRLLTVADPSADGAMALLDERASELRRCGLTVSTGLERGDAAAVLMRAADEGFADLVVVGSRGLGTLASAVLGSVSAELVDHAPCPVLVVRSASASRMLLATDGTESSYRIPRVMASWDPGFRGLPVEVLSVAVPNAFVTPWAPEPDEDLVYHEGLARQVADEMVDLGWSAAAIARAGSPVREIVSAGRDWRADLIVTGSRGLSTLQRFTLGSVAHGVLFHAHASVLVIRGLVPARQRRRACALSIALAT